MLKWLLHANMDMGAHTFLIMQLAKGKFLEFRGMYKSCVFRERFILSCECLWRSYIKLWFLDDDFL